MGPDGEEMINFASDGSCSRACTPQLPTAPSTVPSTPATYNTRAITPYSLPDSMPLTPTLCKAVTMRRSATAIGDSRPRDTTLRVELVPKPEPVYKPRGQGPFKKAWINRTPKPASPAAILADRACIPRPSAFTAPSANTKVSRKFGNDTGRHGERRVCTPGFGRYSGRDSSFASWLGPGVDRNDNPGPGRYICSSPKTKYRSKTPQASSQGLKYAPATWGRSKRAEPIEFNPRDFDLQSEFGGRVDLGCVRRSSPKCSMGGVPAPEAHLAATGPGPGVYYPSIDAARKDCARPQSFASSSRSATLDLMPQARDLGNAGPKYAMWDGPTKRNRCGYPSSQCTFPRAERKSKAVYRFGTRDLQTRVDVDAEPVG